MGKDSPYSSMSLPRHALPALANSFSDTQAFSSDPIYWPSFQPSCSGKILTPALQSSSLLLSSDIIGDFSIHFCEPQTTWLLSFSPPAPNDHFLRNTTDTHSHGSSPDLVITRNCPTSKKCQFKYYPLELLQPVIPCSFSYRTLFYNSPATCRPIHWPTAPSLPLTFYIQSNIKSCQLYLQIILTYCLFAIVFPVSGSQYRQ